MQYRLVLPILVSSPHWNHIFALMIKLKTSGNRFRRLPHGISTQYSDIIYIHNIKKKCRRKIENKMGTKKFYMSVTAAANEASERKCGDKYIRFFLHDSRRKTITSIYLFTHA